MHCKNPMSDEKFNYYEEIVTGVGQSFPLLRPILSAKRVNRPGPLQVWAQTCTMWNVAQGANSDNLKRRDGTWQSQ
jgi:hypothetical protein